MDIAKRISQLSPEQREIFEKKLVEQGIDILQLPVYREDRTNGRHSPLSFGQERLWFIQQLEPGNTAYNLVRATKLEGRLNKNVLTRSINQIIRRHEILRTAFSFEEEKPVQVVLPELDLSLDHIDLEELNPAEQEKEIDRVIYTETSTPFDLSKGPLLRTKLMRLSENEHVFLLVIHHIISDGTSIQVFIRELVQLYQVFLRELESPLPELPVQYIDFVYWQRRWFGEAAADAVFRKKQETFWLDEFSGQIPLLTLPYDFPRPAVQSFAGDTVAFDIKKDEARILEQLALKEKTTIYVVLLTVFNIFLAKLSGMEDIITGTPVSGRRHPDVQPLIGMFVNTLALRNFPVNEKKFIDFLREVKDRTLSAFENQEYRYEDIIEKVNINRDTGRNPLFDVMFLVKNVDYAKVDIPGLTLNIYEEERRTAMFDLTLSAWEQGDTLVFGFEYCTALFKKSTIAGWIDAFKQVVGCACENVDVKIRDIDILTEEERKKILFDFNDTEMMYPVNKTIHELFEEQVEKSPDGSAIIFENSMLSYRELNVKANLSARQLRVKNVRPDTIVGIMVERSFEMIIGIMGILKSGGAYLPIDPTYPQDRIAFMLRDSGAKIMVTSPVLSKKIEELSIVDCESLKVNETVPERSKIDKPPKEADSIKDYQLPITNDPLEYDSLAYVIYTSGTTGRPRGVMVGHENVVNVVTWFAREYDVKMGSNVLQMSNYTFDASVNQIFATLLYGGRLHLVSNVMLQDIGALRRYIERHLIHILNFVPLFLDELLSHRERLRSVQTVISGGEALTGSLKDRITGKGYRLYNHYGPTETTIDALSSRCDPSCAVTLGKSIANTRCVVLDKWEKLVPIGIRGELAVAGTGVTRGYLNRPELTAEKFAVDICRPGRACQSYSSYKTYRTYSSPKLYKTGDLVRWLPDGSIEFLGRLDHQVKIRGFRVELEEIEKHLQDHEYIKEAVVMAGGQDEDKYLCAYITAAGELDVSGLREYLSRDLPDYMIPSYFVQIDKIPLTANGKVDRKALAKHKGKQLETGTTYVAPSSDIERIVADLWKEVLDLDEVGIYDNFFELGGNSMNVIRLNARLKDALSKDIPVAVMFQHLSVSSFARYIMESERDALQPGKKNSRQKEEALQHSKKIFKETIKKTRGFKHAGKQRK